MKSIYVPVEFGFRQVKLDSILYIEDVVTGVLLVTTSDVYVLYVSLKEIEWLLPRENFCKTHPLFVVNLEAVIGFDEGKVYIDNAEVPLDASCKEQLMKCLNIPANDHSENMLELMSGFSLN